MGYKHGSGIAAKEFLKVDSYVNVKAWWERIKSRPAVQKGLTVCAPWLAIKPAEPEVKEEKK